MTGADLAGGVAGRFVRNTLVIGVLCGGAVGAGVALLTPPRVERIGTSPGDRIVLTLNCQVPSMIPVPCYGIAVEFEGTEYVSPLTLWRVRDPQGNRFLVNPLQVVEVRTYRPPAAATPPAVSPDTLKL